MFSLGAFCHPYWVFWLIQHQCAVDAIDKGEEVSHGPFGSGSGLGLELGSGLGLGLGLELGSG